MLFPVEAIAQTDRANKELHARMRILIEIFRKKSRDVANLNVTLRSLLDMLLQSSSVEVELAKHCSQILKNLPRPITEPPYPVYALKDNDIQPNYHSYHNTPDDPRTHN